VALINDMFLAGAETSANSLSMLVRRMIQHPEVQAKIRAEIHEVVGTNRRVSLADSKK